MARFTDQYEEEDVNLYLDKLRESGKTNMFGAGAYLMSEFNMTRQQASKALTEWMRTFSTRHLQD